MPDSSAPLEPEDLLEVALEHKDELGLLAGARLTESSSELLLLTPEEANALERLDGGNATYDDLDAGGRALEALGRLRLRRVLELANSDAEVLEPEKAAAQAWALLVNALDSDGTMQAVGGRELEGYVNAYLGLRAHGNNRAVDELRERLTGVELTLRRLMGPASNVVDVAERLGGDTFEGRLEDLGRAIRLLEEATR